MRVLLLISIFIFSCSAFSAQGDSCFVFGYIGSFVKDKGDECKFERSLLKKQGSCKKNQIMCNPVIFGSGICIDESQSIKSNNKCLKKSKDNKSIARLIKDSDKKYNSEYEEVYRDIGDICEDPPFGDSRNQTYCSLIKKKIEDIGEILNSIEKIVPKDGLQVLVQTSEKVNLDKNGNIVKKKDKPLGQQLDTDINAIDDSEKPLIQYYNISPFEVSNVKLEDSNGDLNLDTYELIGSDRRNYTNKDKGYRFSYYQFQKNNDLKLPKGKKFKIDGMAVSKEIMTRLKEDINNKNSKELVILLDDMSDHNMKKVLFGNKKKNEYDLDSFPGLLETRRTISTGIKGSKNNDEYMEILFNRSKFIKSKDDINFERFVSTGYLQVTSGSDKFYFKIDDGLKNKFNINPKTLEIEILKNVTSYTIAKILGQEDKVDEVKGDFCSEDCEFTGKLGSIVSNISKIFNDKEFVKDAKDNELAQTKIYCILKEFSKGCALSKVSASMKKILIKYPRADDSCLKK